MYSIFLKDADSLPVIETSSDTFQINEFVDNGYRAIVRLREPNRKLYQFRLLLQNNQTGAVAEVTSRRMFVQYGQEVLYPESEWTLVHQGEI